MPRSPNHFLGADLQQSRVGFAVMGKGRLAFRMAESNRADAKWAGADRIGRAKEADGRDAESAGQVERARVTSDKDPGAAGKRDQFSNVAPDQESVSGARVHYCLGQTLLSG